MTAEHTIVPGIPVILTFTAGDTPNIWASLIGLDNAIVKLASDDLSVLDTYVPSERETDPPNIPLGLTGAYSLVNADGRFMIARSNFVSFFEDADAADPRSGIALAGRTVLPDSLLCGTADVVAGMAMTYDGTLVLATDRGNVVAAPLNASGTGLDLDAASVVSINDAAVCDDPAAPFEQVSNNLAVDEEGGVYVVSSAAMYRFDWAAGSLSQTWRAEYVAEGNEAPIRLGPGSGSTPSLAGTGSDADKFVVITDGQQLMNLVFMWRDEIPEGWEPIAPGKDPRIACEVPVDFGDASATTSSSEQSVLVRGYAAVVVNNLLSNPTIVEEPLVQNLISALEGGQADKQPYGVHRIDWDPAARTCVTRWTNGNLSIPNGIPSMGAQTGLMYGIGRRDGAWGVQAIDFETGADAAWWPTPADCSDADRAGLGPFAALPAVVSALDADPQYCENSFYAATTVGPDGVIYTGTIGQVSRYIPSEVTGG